MKSIDLKDLINGLITVITIALVIGCYDDLRAFAKREFIKSMKASSSNIKRSYVQ